MRRCLRAIVEAEHSYDDVRVLRWHADGADAAAEISFGMAVLFEFYLESFLKIAGGSGNHHGPASELGASFFYLQVEFLSKLPDLFNIGRIGSVGFFEVGPRQMFEAGLLQRAL